MDETATLYGDAGNEEDRLAFLDKVFEAGCTFWDTAEVCILCRVVLYYFMSLALLGSKRAFVGWSGEGEEKSLRERYV